MESTRPQARLRKTSASRLVLALALALVPASGCDAGWSARTAADRPLGRWEARASELFDDNIDPAALGLSLEGANPRADALLRERAQTADFVGRVRVQTVTVDKVGDDTSYHLVIQAVGAPLATSRIADVDFELNIKPASRAYPIAKAFDSRLRGQTFVGFVQRYASVDGEPEVHFHLAPDTPEIAAAVKEAVALAELSR